MSRASLFGRGGAAGSEERLVNKQTNSEGNNHAVKVGAGTLKNKRATRKGSWGGNFRRKAKEKS